MELIDLFRETGITPQETSPALAEERPATTYIPLSDGGYDEPRETH